MEIFRSRTCCRPPEKKQERRFEGIGAVVGGFTGAVLCLPGVGGAGCIQNAISGPPSRTRSNLCMGGG